MKNSRKYLLYNIISITFILFLENIFVLKKFYENYLIDVIMNKMHFKIVVFFKIILLMIYDYDIKKFMYSKYWS